MHQKAIQASAAHIEGAFLKNVKRNLINNCFESRENPV
jgi:hypothetical protein